jgi:hypothetical protein
MKMALLKIQCNTRDKEPNGGYIDLRTFGDIEIKLII